MKKYNNQSNVVGNLIKDYRERNNFTKGEISRKLQLHGVNLDITEIHRIETGRMIVKDFEIIAFCRVLDISYEDLKSLIE